MPTLLLASLLILQADAPAVLQADAAEVLVPDAPDPGTRARWEEWIELGLQRSVLIEARALFKTTPAKTTAEATTNALHNPELTALAARAAAATGDLPQAQRWLAASQGPAIQIERARILLHQDHLDEALALLLTTPATPATRHPDRPDGWLLPARALARSGHAQRARPLLEQFLARFPHDDEAPAALHLLAQAALARADHDSARTLRQRATQAARWRAYYDARRRQALEHPNDPLPPFGIAALWMEAAEPERALTILDALLTTSPNHARSHALRGDAARALNRLDTSLSAWSRALDLNPSLHTARLNRAILLTTRNQHAAAKADLTLLVQLPEAATEPISQAHTLLEQVLQALREQ